MNKLYIVTVLKITKKETTTFTSELFKTYAEAETWVYSTLGQELENVSMRTIIDETSFVRGSYLWQDKNNEFKFTIESKLN